MMNVRPGVVMGVVGAHAQQAAKAPPTKKKPDGLDTNKRRTTALSVCGRGGCAGVSILLRKKPRSPEEEHLSLSLIADDDIM